MFTNVIIKNQTYGNFFTSCSISLLPTNGNYICRKFKSSLYLSNTFFNLNTKFSPVMYPRNERVSYFTLYDLLSLWWANNAVIGTSFSQRAKLPKFRVAQLDIIS